MICDAAKRARDFLPIMNENACRDVKVYTFYALGYISAKKGGVYEMCCSLYRAFQ